MWVTAVMQSSSANSPRAVTVVNPIRNLPGSAPTSSRNDVTGEGERYASPGAGPATTSSNAALSRTVRVRAWVQPTGYANASSEGVFDTRPRDGFNPNSPHDEAGMRIEPPPSLPCAIGTIPAATAAADPPLEPPAERERSCGFRVGPWSTGSVVPFFPSSGVFVMPSTITPAARARATARLSTAATSSANSRDPREVGIPATSPPRLFTR